MGINKPHNKRLHRTLCSSENEVKFEIIPNVGAGPILLGMSRDEVKNILGKTYHSGSSKNSEYYFKNSIQVEFLEGKADFIGLSYSRDYVVTYLGNNVFNTEATELFTIISKQEKEIHKYDSYEYLFPEQVITLWDADEQYDYIGNGVRNIWAQVGVGSLSYLNCPVLR